jgi:hypothetical protein
MVRIGAEGGVHPNTVRRFVVNGLPVRALTRRRIEAAAQKLGLRLPLVPLPIDANAPGQGGASQTGGTRDAASHV